MPKKVTNAREPSKPDKVTVTLERATVDAVLHAKGTRSRFDVALARVLDAAWLARRRGADLAGAELAEIELAADRFIEKQRAAIKIERDRERRARGEEPEPGEPRVSFSHDLIADTSGDRAAKNEPRKRARQRFVADVSEMLGEVGKHPDGPDDLLRMRAEILLGRPARHGLTSAWPSTEAAIARIAKMLRKSLDPLDAAKASPRSIAIAVLVETGMSQKDAENAVDRT